MSTTITFPIASGQAPRSAVVAGLRRVDSVRVIVGARSTVAVVRGVARRYPREFRISLATAAALADAGVPLVIDCQP
jgi:hypothetical protein